MFHLYGKTNDSSRALIHDHHHKCDVSLADSQRKQIHAPQAVFGVAQEAEQR
jgi:hypothetical protein